MRETYQHSLTTATTREIHVKHFITRPRGLLWEAWEDFSYDLALQAADSKQVEEDELMFCRPTEWYCAALSRQDPMYNFGIFSRN